jgi:hypothetical protein
MRYFAASGCFCSRKNEQREARGINREGGGRVSGGYGVKAEMLKF